MTPSYHLTYHLSILIALCFLLASSLSMVRSNPQPLPLTCSIQPFKSNPCFIHSIQSIFQVDQYKNSCKDDYIGKRLGSLSSITLIRGGFLDRLPNPFQSTSSSSDFSSLLKATSPDSLFNNLLGGLAGSSVVWKAYDFIKSRSSSSSSNNNSVVKPKAVLSLQQRFLIVFWLLRMADWLQGPYFYEVYSSKRIDGIPVSLDLVSKLFLIGFATTGIFGPFIGRVIDQRGRRLGTILYAILYSLSAVSTQSSSLAILAFGRITGGLGTSLLFSAPEAWLVGEHQKQGFDSKWLGQTFGWAYSGDALVAITAGQLASMSASRNGPSGPFLTSIAFLLAGSVLASLTWAENTAAKVSTSTDMESSQNKEKTSEVKTGIASALKTIVEDKRIFLVGAIQALFEGAMYIFVLQWPPMLKAVIQAAPWSGLVESGTAAAAATATATTVPVPYGKIFSCFMACCLLGSSSFNALQSLGIAAEVSTTVMLFLATIAMAVATFLSGGSNAIIPFLGVTVGGMQTLTGVVLAFFLFEVCVGMYFPSIGLLRSKYIPDDNRSVIMNLFGLPLNLIVVSVFLSIKALGVQGALGISTLSLAIATTLMTTLLAMKKS